MNSEAFAAIMALDARDALLRALREETADVTLPQATKLSARLLELSEPAHSIRLGIVHTYTSDLLDPWIDYEMALQGLRCETYHAPYGFLLQEAQANSELAQHNPDITLLMLQREDLHPDLKLPLAALDEDQRRRLHDVALSHAQQLVQQFRDRVSGHIVVSFLPTLAPPGLGLFDTQSDRSESTWWSQFKAAAAQHLRAKVPSSVFLDMDQCVNEVGRAHFFDLRLWYSSRYPFAPQGAREIARRLAAIAATIKYPKAKVIVLDADNTLWGGVIGEDGLDGIALGPDYPGNTFVAFQRRLLELQQRGFILAMCSKNNAADVEEVFQKHPHQLLKAHHFVASRINWDPKPQNLESLAKELSLGLDSFVFVDDSDHECSIVRHALPQVEIVQVPKNPIHIARCLDRVARLEVLSLTEEDREKTQMYAQEQQRRELERDVTQRGGDLADYLRSLNMRMDIGIDDTSKVPRLAQLTQKTNQFNLTTRRYSEQQVQEFIQSGSFVVSHFSLTDSFGNSGVVGLAILERAGQRAARLDTFLMSCRVIGRCAESAFLETLLRKLAAEGIDEVDAEFLPTKKNALAKDFLTQHGFKHVGEHRYRRSLASAPPKDEADFPIQIVSASGDSQSRPASQAA